LLTEPACLLLIEDDPAQRLLLAAYLRNAGFQVVEAESVAQGRTQIQKAKPRLVLLDLNLPDGDGLVFARELRQHDLPMIIVSIREEDRIDGLELGVDDFVTKPYQPRELVARVNNVLRRSQSAPAGTLRRFGAYLLDPACRLVRDGSGREVELTQGEFNLLAELVHASGRVVSRADLAEAIHPEGEIPSGRSVDVLISRLRQKLEPDPASPRLILTVPGQGYRLRP
jgi:DNA-binding response OmpR family regulator